MKNRSQIICVEDTDVDALLLQKVLQDAGYAVDIALNAIEALNMMRYQHYDLAIVDQVMPQQTGLEMMSALRDMKAKPLIIMLTAHNDPLVANQAYELGANHFIIKDEHKRYLANLPAAVHQTLAQKQTIKELEREKQKAERINLNLMLLNHTSQILTSSQDTEQITTRFVQTIASIIQTQGATLWLYPTPTEADQKIDSLICSAAYSVGRHIPLKGVLLPLSEGIAGWVATHGESVVTNAALNDPRYSSRFDSLFDYQTESILAVPLKCQNKIVGVLQLINKQDQPFDHTDTTLAGTLAAYAANAIVNVQLMEQLRRQNEELALQNADLNAYSDSVAHDLKNPITHILGYADSLRESYSEMPLNEINEHLDIIVDQSQHMSSIIEELLLLARIRMNPSVTPEVIAMDTVVDNVIKRLTQEINAKNAQIILPKEWAKSIGYGPWLEGVWYNYISNGLRYGGTPPILSIAATTLANGMVRFEVQDNGSGLTPSEQDLLFKPFPKLTTTPKGNGLGLVIVQRVIEHLNGTVGVESRPGFGSSFYFTLPSASAAD